MPEHPPLSIRLLGPLDVRIHGEPLPPLRSRKGYWLLALLVLRAGREVRREWLAETLWPDSFGEEAFASLRQSLRDLRLKLGPQAERLQSPTTRTLRFDPTGTDIDVLAFDVALHRAQPDDLKAAVRLYTGPLLEGCAELWVLPEREAREQGYLGAVEQLALQALASGDPTAAARILKPAVWIAPLRQSMHRTLMQALADLGEFQGAVEVYQELRRRLYHDYNTQPDPDTQRTFREIRAAGQTRAQQEAVRPAVPVDRTPPAGRPTPRPTPALASPILPQPLTALVGREAELERVLTLLAPATHAARPEPVPPVAGRLVTLTGPGGVGKTRLALEVAHRLAERFSDGALFIELPGVRHEADLHRTVALALGVSQEEAVPLPITITQALHHRELLLVFDNCEQIVKECAFHANFLLRRCPRLRILATSRERLGLTGETLHPVSPLPTAQGVEVWERGGGGESQFPTANPQPPLSAASPAATLFLQRVEAAVPTFHPDETGLAAVETLCRKLDGLPLALELAAPLVELMPLPELVERLDRRFELLAHGDPTAPERHQSLRALVDWSYTLLSGEEQQLFRHLSVFPGSWTLSTAEAVATIPAPLAPLLQRLVTKSLVLADPEQAPAPARRFRLLATLREYAADRLHESEEEETIRLRHLEHAADQAEAAATALTGPDQLLWLARLDADYDSLRAALTWSIRHRSAATTELGRSALRLAAGLGRYWQIRGLFSEGYRLLTTTLAESGEVEEYGSVEISPPTPPHSATSTLLHSARALGWAAFLTTFQGDYLGATRHAEASLALCRQLEHRPGIAAALGTLGIIAKDQGDPERAQILFTESLALYRAEADRIGEASMLGYLGIIAAGQGEPEAARSLYEQSFRIRQELQDRWGIAASLNNLGLLARQLGDLVAARRYLDESLALRRTLGDRRCIAITLNHLGLVSLAEQDLERAQACFRESLALARDTGDRRSMAYSLEIIAGLAATRPSLSDALHAVRLLAAAAHLRRITSVPLSPTEAARQSDSLAHLRNRLGDTEYECAWREGEAMSGWPFTLDNAVALALTV